MSSLKANPNEAFELLRFLLTQLLTSPFLHSGSLTFATILTLQMRNPFGKQQPQLTDGFGLPAGLSSPPDFASGRLTPPTKPILPRDDSLTFVPYCSASFISSAIFLENSSLFFMPASSRSASSPTRPKSVSQLNCP
jgi:hypothetical protein